MRVETGVMLVKDGKAWQVIYEDGQSTVYGWGELETGDIREAEYCKKPSDMTWVRNPDIPEMNTGTLVAVTRLTSVEMHPLA
jgi:hypothetical protein